MISVLPQDVLLISCDGVRAAKGRMKAQGRHLLLISCQHQCSYDPGEYSGTHKEVHPGTCFQRDGLERQCARTVVKLTTCIP